MLILAFLALAAVTMIVQGILALRANRQLQGWGNVMGRAIRWNIEKVSKRRDGRTDWVSLAIYEYKVHGEKYWTTRSKSHRSKKGGAPDPPQGHYPGRVALLYDPLDPTISEPDPKDSGRGAVIRITVATVALCLLSLKMILEVR